MRREWILIVALLCFTLPHVSPLVDTASAKDDYTNAPPFWETHDQNRIYLSGDGADVNLTRDYQGASQGAVTVRSGQSASIGPLSMPPLEMGFTGQFDVSAFTAAYRVSGDRQACQITNAQLTIDYTIVIGSETYQSSVSKLVNEGSAKAVNMSGDVQTMNITALPGQVITFQMTASTTCIHPLSIEWGGSKEFSGGILIVGDLFAPQVEVTVDDAKLAHIEFVATLPWGFDDLDKDYTRMNIYGPLAADEKYTKDDDYHAEAFVATAQYVERLNDTGSPAKVYTGKKQLPEGDNVLIVCIKTVDSQDLNTMCDHEGIIRFEVEQEDGVLASASLWLSISGFVSVIVYLISLIRQGILLPFPLIGALIVMALLMIPLASDMPDIGGEAMVDDDARAPSFLLHQHNSNSSLSLDELMSGKDAVIIGISLPASTNAADQADQIQAAVDLLDGRVAAAQIITGEDARMDDMQVLANMTNSSFPVLFDNGDPGFASRMPHGQADSIVIIDKSGHITFSAAGSAATDDMVDAVNEIGLGGQQDLLGTLDLFWGPGLAMMLVALPRKRYEAPEESLTPGSNWGSIVLAGGMGFLMVNFLPLVMGFIPGNNDLRTYVDLALIVWFISAAVRAAMVGTPKEVRWLSGKFYNRFSEEFRNWKDREDFERDLLIGFWMGWFIWLATPALMPQGVAALTMTGGASYLFGPFMLLMHILVAGVLTLIIRLIATWGGPLSSAFGSFGSGPFSEALGWALIPISIWVLIDAILDAMAIGIF